MAIRVVEANRTKIGGRVADFPRASCTIAVGEALHAHIICGVIRVHVANTTRAIAVLNTSYALPFSNVRFARTNESGCTIAIFNAGDAGIGNGITNPYVTMLV